MLPLETQRDSDLTVMPLLRRKRPTSQPINVPAPRLYKRSSSGNKDKAAEKEAQPPSENRLGLGRPRASSSNGSPNLASPPIDSGAAGNGPDRVRRTSQENRRTKEDQAIAAMKGFGSRLKSTELASALPRATSPSPPSPGRQHKQHDLSSPDPATQYKLLEKIGSGSFGVVYKATHLASGTMVAIKQIDLEDSDDDITEIQQEIAHLSACDSEWVTRYYGSFVREYKLWIGEFIALVPSLEQLTNNAVMACSNGVFGWRILPRSTQAWPIFGGAHSHHLSRAVARPRVSAQ